MRKILVLLVLLFPSLVLSEPTTEPVNITHIRPYNSTGSGAVFIHTDTTSLCDTSVYKIDLSWGGSKEILSVALAALMANKQVRIEIDNAGCTGWGSRIQSMYILK
jgi:steroid 5-alpha reductase family enzyme